MLIYRIYSRKTIYRKGKVFKRPTSAQDTFSAGFLRRIDCGLSPMFCVFFLRRHRRELKGGKERVTIEEEKLEEGCTDVDREKGRRKRVALFFLDVDLYCLFGLDQQLYRPPSKQV